MAGAVQLVEDGARDAMPGRVRWHLIDAKPSAHTPPLFPPSREPRPVFLLFFTQFASFHLTRMSSRGTVLPEPCGLLHPGPRPPHPPPATEVRRRNDRQLSTKLLRYTPLSSLSASRTERKYKRKALMRENWEFTNRKKGGGAITS